jgi:hypothetical protein
MMIGKEQIHQALEEFDHIPADDQLKMLGINGDDLVEFALRLEEVGVGGLASSFCAGFTLGMFVEKKRQEDEDDLEYGVDGT